MYKRYLYLILLILIIVPSTASEVSGPLSYVKYDGNGYTITGADAPSLLLEKEILSIDLSNGTTIDPDHFYYAGTQEENKVDYLGKAYTIEVINDTAVLSAELWKSLDMKIDLHDKTYLPEGYALEFTEMKDGGKATFVLTHDQRTLDSFSIEENGVYNYSEPYEGKSVVLFSCTAGSFLHEDNAEKVVLKEISIGKADVLKDGQDLFEDHIISLEDIDWDGDDDIVVRLKPGNTFTISPSEDVSLLGGYICLKSEIVYNHLLDRLDGSVPLTSNDEYKIYSYRHNDVKDLNAVLENPSPESIFSVAPYVKFNRMGTISTNTSAETISSMQLRGQHEIYTYIHNETLNLSISKHDLNWYEGEDELNITVYSPSGEIIGSMSIPDDGQTSATRIAGNVQTETLEVPGLQDDIYHIKLTSNDDIVIDELRSTQDKLVFAGKMFILSSGDVYAGSNGRFSLKFMTLHDEGLQDITIEGNNRTYHAKLDTKNKWVNIRLPASSSPYHIEILKGDIKVESDAYFAFSKEAFFSKEEATVVSLYDTISKKEEANVDYIIVPLQKEQIAFYPYRNATDPACFDISNYDDELNTWTSPGLFYFDTTGKRNWEFLQIAPGDDKILSKDEIVYGSLQYHDKGIHSPLNRTIAYLGEPYSILDIDNSSAILSRIMTDIDIKVNSSSKIELGDGMDIQMHAIDPDARKIRFSLYREGIILSDFEMGENDIASYKEVIMNNEMPLVNIGSGEIVKDINSSRVLLRINRINSHIVAVKDDNTFRDGSTTEIDDINGDGLQDIKITLEENTEIRLEEGKTVPILGGYLALEPAENDKMLVSKKNVHLEESTLNIRIQYGTDISFTKPVKEIPITINNTNLSNFNIYYNNEVNDLSFLLKELKKLPGGENGIEGDIYNIYDLSLNPNDPSTINIEFLVEKQWLKHRRLDPEGVCVAYFKNGKWLYTAANIIGDQGENFKFSATLRDPGTFCILGLPDNSEGYKGDPESIPDMLRSISDDINVISRDLDNGSVEVLSSKAKSSDAPIYITLLIFIACVAILLTYVNRDTSFIDRTEKPHRTEKYVKIMEFNRRLCLTLLASFMIVLIAEEILQGSVSSHLNTDVILIFVVITGLIDLVGRKLRKKDGL